MTDCIVRSRIDPYIKAKAVKVFEHMGLTLSQAIRVFLYQSVTNKCIPFAINAPNATTRSALEAVTLLVQDKVLPERYRDHASG